MTDEELDALVAEKVMGWHKHKSGQSWFDAQGQYHTRVYNWRPLENIDDAMMLTTRERLAHRPFGVKRDCFGETEAWFGTTVANVPSWDMAPRAICLAALKACGIEVS